MARYLISKNVFAECRALDLFEPTRQNCVRSGRKRNKKRNETKEKKRSATAKKARRVTFKRNNRVWELRLMEQASET